MRYRLWDRASKTFLKNSNNRYKEYNNPALAQKRAKLLRREGVAASVRAMEGETYVKRAYAKRKAGVGVVVPSVEKLTVEKLMGKITGSALPPFGRLDRIEQQLKMMEKRLDQLFDNTKTVKELLTKYTELHDQLK